MVCNHGAESLACLTATSLHGDLDHTLQSHDRRSCSEVSSCQLTMSLFKNQDLSHIGCSHVSRP